MCQSSKVTYETKFIACKNKALSEMGPIMIIGLICSSSEGRKYAPMKTNIYVIQFNRLVGIFMKSTFVVP